ncbi:unnamed protein product [Didymodactylos carnosus]|uniref:NAD(+)--protein-arginine ADP-ribosyltransferase n=1 Tax=Didymodactylos carnosus TaxID=1234261 RepID=A0A8S2HFQ9_9BILA|nr:unnamed protein product [Didymodactylos carnosus]CAF3640988.1 unnamed protein product [Didymodactylos carnosus]
MATNSSSSLSDFYLSCRNDDIEKVKAYLKTLTVRQINRLEPNGSTALHAASYYGHTKTVQLLLEKGITSRSIINKYRLTAYQEAKTNEIKQLFRRQNGSSRFVGGTNGTNIEWNKIGINIEKEAIKQRYDHSDKWDDSDIRTTVSYIYKDYLDKNLRNLKDIALINWYYALAAEENTAKYLITAYTAETDYYKVLNKELATVHENENKLIDSWVGRNWILRIMCCHPTLNPFGYIGNAYRGMRITQDDLNQYSVGNHLMNKAFLSTSKDREIAEKFASLDDIQDGKLSIICIYIIRNRRAALDVETISDYPEEHEILIMPYCVFEVKYIRRNINNSVCNVEIVLKQCETDKLCCIQ